MSKVTSSVDPAAEVPATQSGAAAQRGRAKSRPSAKAGGPVRSPVPHSSKRPASYSDLGRDARLRPSDGRRPSWKSWPGNRRPRRQLAPWACRRCIITCWSGTRCRDWWRPACRAKGPPGPRPEQELVRLRRELEP